MESQTPQQKRFFEFGPFCIDATERVLMRDGKPLDLPPKLFDTLLALVEQSGHIVEKNALMEKVWPDAFVEESNLVSNVSLLRKALGDDEAGQPFIQTIPRRGYRFVAEVNERLADDVDLIVHRRTRARFITHEDDQAPVLPEFSGALKTLAILPFMTIGLPPEEDYLGLGLTDALITQFGNTNQMTVRPTSSVRPFMRAPQDSVAIGRALRVSSVLEGSVQRADERVRVTVRLINVDHEVTLWAEKFDAPFTDIFQVQDTIADQVARKLMLKLSGAERSRLMRRYTQNVEAYQLFLKGRYEWSTFSPQGVNNSIECYNRAIAIDAGYALAYTGLAYSYTQLAHTIVRPLEGYELAKTAAGEALALDHMLVEAHCAQAVISYFFDWDWEATESSLQHALALNQNVSDIHQMQASLWITRGRTEEALAEIKWALELDPLSSLHRHTRVQILHFARRYDEALVEAQHAVDANPHFFLAHVTLGNQLLAVGRYEEAIAEMGKGAAAFPREPSMQGCLGYANALAGRRDVALMYLSQMEEAAPTRYIPAYWIALIHTGLADKEAALTWLEKAYEEKYFFMVWLNVNPHFDLLHSEPRFIEILRRLGSPRLVQNGERFLPLRLGEVG